MVRFIGAEYGNLDFEIIPFGRFQATCYNDPFPSMLIWLESIAAGADLARWIVDYEGGADQIIFAAATDLCFSKASAQLVHILGDEDFCGKAASCLVKRRIVVERFYSAFRSFIESEDYDPKEWEYQWGLHETFEDIPEDQHSWEGERLSTLRSPAIESYLRAQPVQLLLIEQPQHENHPISDN